MWFPLTTSTAIVCLLLAIRHEPRSSLVLGLAAWLFALIAGSPILFSYTAVKYSFVAELYLSACLICITVGYLVVRTTPRQTQRPYPARDLEIRVAQTLSAIGALGCVLLLLDVRTGISPGAIIANLSQTREAAFEGLETGANRGALGTLGGFLAPCAVIGLLAAVFFRRDRNRLLTQLAIINLALVALVSLAVFAGRATVTNAALLAVIGLYLTSGKFRLRIRLRTVLVGIAAFAAIGYLSTAFIGQRTENTSGQRILERTQRAEIRPWLQPIVRNNPAASYALVSIGYFASPIPTFHFYEAAPIPGPFYGRYSFQFPARIVETAAGTWTRSEWINIRQQVFGSIEARGYPPNVWATWPRDLLIDFGYLGALMFCAAFGAFMAWARNQSQATGALHYYLFETIVCFTFGFGAFTSFMYDSFLAYPFLMTIPLMIFVRAHATVTVQPILHRSVYSQPGS